MPVTGGVPRRRGTDSPAKRGLLLAATTVALRFGDTGMAHAQAALERHPVPLPAPRTPPSIGPAPPPTDEDSRPLGATLEAMILLGAEDAADTAAPAGGVDASRLEARDRVDLRRRLTPFLAQPLSRKLISRVQVAIVRHYRRVGRPFVAVSLPPQEITGGVLRVRVVEFRLGGKTVIGASPRVARSVTGGVRARIGQPIDAVTLEQDLDWLNRSPFRQVSAAFTPGAALAETDLRLEVRSIRPWQVTAGYSNAGTRSSGYDRWFVGGQAGDILVPGSLVAYQVTASGDFWFANREPFGAVADPRYVSHSLVIAAPLAPRQDLTFSADYIQSRTDSQDFTVRARTVEFTATYRTALSNLVLLPGDLSLGVEARDQQTDTDFGGVRVLRGGAQVGQLVVGWSDAWAAEGARQSLTVTGHISPGDLTSRNSDAAFQAFTSGRVGQASYAYVDLSYGADVSLAAPWRYVAAINARIADRPLIDTEQFAVGGEGGSRTYVYDDQSFDSGAVWRNELRGPIVTAPQGRFTPAISTAPYLFLDGAYAWDLHGGPHQFAGSTGLGLDWSLGARLSGGLAGGWSLADAAFTRAGQFKLMAKARLTF